MDNYAARIQNETLMFNFAGDTTKLRAEFLDRLQLPKSTQIESKGELLHMFCCFLQTDKIKEDTKDVLIPKKSPYNAIIIEDRTLPHLEFILRNAILKLDFVFSHTLVCTQKSYKKMYNFCKQINENINIIGLDIEKINQASYNDLLLTKEFWNLFDSEHLLIHQQDSIIFREGVSEFLKYDYIGAPWLNNQDDNALGVGNGGFSLRKKSKLIKCLDTINPQEASKGESTKRYMKNVGLNSIPEDVFFSKTMIDHNIGAVANRKHANIFSQERIPSINPFGGHQYWLAPQAMIANNTTKHQ